MEIDWVMVYSADNPQSIVMIKSTLETNSIDSVEMDKQDSGYKIGDMELYVRKENVMRAKYLIDKKS